MGLFGISPQSSVRHRVIATVCDAGSVFSLAVPVLYGQNASPELSIGAVCTGTAFLAGKVICQIKGEAPVADMAAVTTSLKVVHSLVMDQKKSTRPGEDELRLCLYAKLPQKDVLRRITGKIGDSGDASEPADISTPIGVVGVTYRTGRAWHASAPPSVNLTEFLVSNWSFSHELASKVRQDRRSWYGVPLKGTSATCFGVLFCDSCDSQFFGKTTDKDTPRRKMLRASAVPIAEALKAAYHSLSK